MSLILEVAYQHFHKTKTQGNTSPTQAISSAFFYRKVILGLTGSEAPKFLFQHILILAPNSS